MTKRFISIILSVIFLMSSAEFVGADGIDIISERREYDNVLLDESFDKMTEINPSEWELKSTSENTGLTYDVVNKSDFGLGGATEDDKAVKIAKTAADATKDNYFRMNYSGGSVIEKQCDVTKLTKMQIDFDIYFDEFADVYVRFYESGSKSDNLLCFKKSGKLLLTNGSDTYDAGAYKIDEWMNMHVYFDFIENTYDVYIGEELLKAGLSLQNIDNYIISFGPYLWTADLYTFYFDNAKVKIPREFCIKSSYPVDGAQRVSTEEIINITLSNFLAGFDKSMLLVRENGEEFTGFEAVEKNGVITVTFPSKMAYGTQYEIVLTENLKDIFGQELSDSISFTTVKDGEIALTPALREEILNAVNNGDVETVINSYRDVLGFVDSMFNGDVYELIEAQKPFEEYSEFMEAVTVAAELINNVNDTSASEMLVLIEEYGDILFGDVSNYYEFCQMSNNDKKAVCKKIADKSPYEDLRQLKIRFSVSVAGIGEPESTDRPVYTKAILDESFDETKAIMSNVWERKSTTGTAGLTYDIVNASEYDVANADEHIRVLKMSKDTTSIDNYFRMTYANRSGLVAGAYNIDDLQYVQIDFDIYFTERTDMYVRFYDSLSGSSTKFDNIFIFKENGDLTFLNGKEMHPYNAGEWYTFHTYFNFIEDTYTVYMDETLLEADIPTKSLDSCLVSYGPYTNTSSEAYTVYLDNMRFIIPDSFKINATFPCNGETNANVAEDVVFSFSNPVDSFDVSETVITEDGKRVSDFEVKKVGSEVSISFPQGLKFHSEYEVILPEYLVDVFGNELGGNRSLSFQTSAETLVASVPEIMEDNASLYATAKAINPNSEEKIVSLMALVYKPDASAAVLLKEEKTVSADSMEDFILQIPYEYNVGYHLKAFVCEKNGTYKMLSEKYAVLPETSISTDEGTCSISLNKFDLNGSSVSISGSLSDKKSKIVFVTITDETENLIYAAPILTDTEGNFETELKLPEKEVRAYYIGVSGKDILNTETARIVYLTENKKEEIKNAVNNGKAESVMTKYRGMLNFSDEVYHDNIYVVIDEQKPYESFDDFEDGVELYDKLWKDINSADFTYLTELFDKYGDIILNGTANADEYAELPVNQKNKINRELVKSLPFESFKELREKFSDNFKSFDSDSGVGGGGNPGGGGNSSSDNGYGGSSIDIVSEDTASSIFEEKQDGFADLNSVPWAQQSICALLEKGIVSAELNYRPTDNITREEFVKMLSELVDIPKIQTPSGFSDDSSDKWYSQYLSGARSVGVINGDPDGSFGVGLAISRQDMAVMAYRALKAAGYTLPETTDPIAFSDSSEISGYAEEAVRIMQQAGILSGMGNGRFAPMENANRAQAAVIVYNMLTEVIE